MLKLRARTPEEAFKKINRLLLFDDETIKRSGGKLMSSQRMLYDVYVEIAHAYVDEDFNFTSLINYRPAKWTSLVNNYVDRTHLHETLSVVHHRELKRDRNYNISFHFSNSHDGGKGCLLTATFARRPDHDRPLIIATVRASETVKRLMMDFLLLYRIGQEAWGEDADFEIRIFFPYMWLASSWAALYIHYDKEAYDMVISEDEGGNSFLSNVFKVYASMKECEDPEKLAYHAMKRVVKVVQNQTAKPPLLAKHCVFKF